MHVSLGAGLYLACTAVEPQHILAAWWVLGSAVLQGAGLMVKDCIARQEGRYTAWVWLMYALILVVFPLALVNCGVGTYLLQAGCREQAVDFVTLLAIVLGLNYAYNVIIVALIVRFVQEHHHRRSTLSPTYILQQRFVESPLTDDEIAKIPEYRATDTSEECPLCLEQIAADMKIKACPICHQSSHSSCINRSLTHKPQCPTCRTNWRQAYSL